MGALGGGNEMSGLGNSVARCDKCEQVPSLRPSRFTPV